MNKFLVFQSDFGLVDGAVSAMEGVAYGIDADLKISHVTHDITPYNIFEGSYRLFQTLEYWPKGTVFVSVVDPGVGSDRKSVVVKTKHDRYIVTPNNGTLTHINRFVGIDEIREIEESVNRRKDTELSYTFHGRDVYAYTGAKLAAGKISYQEVGPQMSLEEIVELELFSNVRTDDSVTGQIDILDVRFGSLWTSISFEEFAELGFKFNDMVEVQIFNNTTMVYSNRVIYGKSFADVSVGMPIVYMNSVYHMALAINQGSFAKAYAIKVGKPWTVVFKRVDGR